MDMIHYHPHPETNAVMKTIIDGEHSLVVSGHFDDLVCAQLETIYDVADILVKGGGFISARPDLSEFNSDYEANYEMLIQLQSDKTCTVYIQNGDLSVIAPCSLVPAQFRNLCRQLLAEGIL